MKLRSRLTAALFGAVLAVAGLLGGAPSASAATVNFNIYHTGEDLGSTVLATLEATQVGSGVRFVLTNSTTGQPESFISQLFLTYTGNLDAVTSAVNIAGKAASSIVKGAGFTNAGLTWNILAEWPTAGSGGGALRLRPGESSTFDIYNMDMAGLFTSDTSAMIHVQGLNSGGSTKYLGGDAPAPVPLPAAGWLMLAGLGGLAALRRKRRAA